MADPATAFQLVPYQNLFPVQNPSAWNLLSWTLMKSLIELDLVLQLFPRPKILEKGDKNSEKKHLAIIISSVIKLACVLNL